jgi:hypothetical protein
MNRLSLTEGAIRPNSRDTRHSPNKDILHSSSNSSSGISNRQRSAIQQTVKCLRHSRSSPVGGTSLQDTIHLNHDPILRILTIVHNKVSLHKIRDSSNSNDRLSKVNGGLELAAFLELLLSRTGHRVSTLGSVGATLRLTSNSRLKSHRSSKQRAVRRFHRSSEVRLASVPNRTTRSVTRGSILAWVMGSNLIVR